MPHIKCPLWLVLFGFVFLQRVRTQDTPSPTPEPTPSPTPEPTPSPTPEPTTPSPTPAPQPRFMAILNGDIHYGILSKTGYATRRNVHFDNATNLSTFNMSAATLQTPPFAYGGAGYSYTDQTFWQSNGSVANSLTFSLNGGYSDTPIYLYVYQWGGGRYDFTGTDPAASLPFTVVSAQWGYRSYVGQTYTKLVVGSGTGFGTTFSGILMFPVGTRSIKWIGTGRLTDVIQYTLAYINPNLTPAPTPEPTPSSTPV